MYILQVEVNVAMLLVNVILKVYSAFTICKYFLLKGHLITGQCQ